MPVSQSEVTRVALLSIGGAIRDLSQPTGRLTMFTALGAVDRDTYAIEPQDERLRRAPPHLWPEVLAVTESLMGAAFVVAQAHLKATGKTNASIEGVANYWKHRDEWSAPWGSGTEAPRPATLRTIVALGAIAPVALGQMQQLARAVLGGAAFDVELLWDAIA
jgi:hypothetical protein